MRTLRKAIREKRRRGKKMLDGILNCLENDTDFVQKLLKSNEWKRQAIIRLKIYKCKTPLIAPMNSPIVVVSYKEDDGNFKEILRFALIDNKCNLEILLDHPEHFIFPNRVKMENRFDGIELSFKY